MNPDSFVIRYNSIMHIEKRCFGMKKVTVFILLAVLTVFLTGCGAEKKKYEIEEVFPDPLFEQIVEEKIIPVKLIHGVDMEGLGAKYSVEDPALIKDYIEAFKAFKIKETNKDEKTFIEITDVGNSYTFCLEDGRKVVLYLDKNTIATDMERGVQYILEENDSLNTVNYKSDILSDEAILSGVKNYCYSENPDLKSIEEKGEYPVYWEIASSEDAEVVVLFRSYTGAQVRYYVERYTGLISKITESQPSVSDEESVVAESISLWNYL